MSDKEIRHKQRSDAIRMAMGQVKVSMAKPHTVEVMEEAKSYLVELANQVDLFPYEDFPIKDGDNEATYRVFADDDGKNALFVYLTKAGGTYRPHDHGKSWAIIAGVHGQERHHFYERIDGGVSDGSAELQYKGNLIVEPGRAASCLVGGIHSIEHVDHQPFLHLHCYGYDFDQQDTRLEYDQEAGVAIYSNDVGELIDMPLAD